MKIHRAVAIGDGSGTTQLPSLSSLTRYGFIGVVLSIVIMGTTLLSAPTAYAQSSPVLTGYVEGIEVSSFPCGPLGPTSGEVAHSSQNCKAVGSRSTGDIFREWFLLKQSGNSVSLYPGVHGVRVKQRVDYGGTEYWQEAGWYTDYLTRYTLEGFPPIVLEKKQTFRPYCYIVGPGTEFYRTGASVEINLLDKSKFPLATILRLEQASACDRDPSRCPEALPGRVYWTWECVFENDTWVMGDGSDRMRASVHSPDGPIIKELRHGFITYDFGLGNDALTEIRANSHFVAPPKRSGSGWYTKDNAEVFWGKDAIDVHDGTHVAVVSEDAWKWKACMGNIPPCQPLVSSCKSCPDPARFERNSGLRRNKIPMSIDATELNSADPMFKTALEAAVSEYNAATGIALFQSPTYGGSAGDITVDLVLDSERSSPPYSDNYWDRKTIDGQLKGTWEPIEGPPGCMGNYFHSADMWISENNPYWDELRVPWGVSTKPWTAQELNDLFLHEMAHAVIRLGHPDKDGPDWMCPSHSILCSGSERNPGIGLTAEDILAIECIYDDIIP